MVHVLQISNRSVVISAGRPITVYALCNDGGRVAHPTPPNPYALAQKSSAVHVAPLPVDAQGRR